ncbi:MAG: nucleotidyltransferase family protein [Gammaproteobacteria bacterium]
MARLVSAATSPSQVILFGSYARGTADEGSDLVLLVAHDLGCTGCRSHRVWRR